MSERRLGATELIAPISIGLIVMLALIMVTFFRELIVPFSPRQARPRAA
ncbi:MAG: hypothetical protein ACREFP_20810 [Acetobacteraceae bacterium]